MEYIMSSDGGVLAVTEMTNLRTIFNKIKKDTLNDSRWQEIPIMFNIVHRYHLIKKDDPSMTNAELFAQFSTWLNGGEPLLGEKRKAVGEPEDTPSTKRTTYESGYRCFSYNLRFLQSRISLLLPQLLLSE
jgi:hypothetical protein